MTNKTNTEIHIATKGDKPATNKYLSICSLKILYHLYTPTTTLDTDYKNFWKTHDE